MKNLAQLQAYAAKHPFPLLFTTVSGAHLYGFASDDSDYDLRGVHRLPLDEVFSLNPERSSTVDTTTMENGLEMDLVTHDVKKFFALLLKKNGYVLEQLYSPIVISTSPEHEELKELSRRCITRHHANHYLGFASSQWSLFKKEEHPRVKPLLYTYRVLLTGIHLMRSGQVEANLSILNQDAKLGFVEELISMKVNGAEKELLPSPDISFHQSRFDELMTRLEEAYRDSQLPEASDAKPALNDLLIRIRRLELV